jgi:predicted RNase H-like nuclease (RuvC/YqgF family)
MDLETLKEETPGLCPGCSKRKRAEKEKYEQEIGMYREQIRLFERQIKQARGNEDELKERIKSMMKISYCGWGRVIRGFEKEYPMQGKTGKAFLKKIEEAIEKAAVLQKCEEIWDGKVEEWDRVLGELRQCWEFYYMEIEVDVEAVEGAFEGAWERAGVLMGEGERGRGDER